MIQSTLLLAATVNEVAPVGSGSARLSTSYNTFSSGSAARVPKKCVTASGCSWSPPGPDVVRAHAGRARAGYIRLIVGLDLPIRLKPPSALAIGLGAFLLVAAALLVGYEVGKMTPSQTSPRFVSVSVDAHCPQTPGNGNAVFRDCVADGVFRNNGGAGSAAVTFHAVNTSTGADTGSCVAAIPRTQAGDVVSVSCTLKANAADGYFRGIPRATVTVGNG